MALNKVLYNALERYYGDVEIVSEGRAMQWRTVPADSVRTGWKGLVRKIDDPGEEYRVRCRSCRDHRPRLYINHRWGVWDPETNGANLHLANCYNESCYSDSESRQRLFELIYGQANSRVRLTVPISAGTARPLEAGAVEWPGPVESLEHLAARAPRHPAVDYLSGRGFDPVALSRNWGVHYCDRSHFANADSRIIIPILDDGKMIGWQARYVGDRVNGMSFNEAGVPKYWTSAGFRRRLYSYNLDRALRHSTLVVVEGPADAWRVGPMATAVLGKTMSPEVRRRLIAGMRKHENPVVLLALDPKQDPGERSRGKVHHLQKLYNELAPELERRVVPVLLPEEYDPGSIDRDWFREICRESARKVGLEVSFARPRVVAG